MTKQSNSLQLFSWTSFAEGVSFVLLLFIAMPFKYLLHIPEPVKYIGWAHGLLFVLYIFLLLYLALMHSWKIKKTVIYFLASLIPFAPFWVHKQTQKQLN